VKKVMLPGGGIMVAENENKKVRSEKYGSEL
jgi:hypothetical protein